MHVHTADAQYTMFGNNHQGGLPSLTDEWVLSAQLDTSKLCETTDTQGPNRR